MLIILKKIISIFLITLVGFIANKKGILPDQSNRYLVDLLMLITSPCMVIASITSTNLTGDTVKTTILMLILSGLWFIGSALLSWIVCTKVLKMKNHPDAGVYMAGLTTINNGFMGFPITLALFGEQVLFYMILFQIMLTLFLYSGCILQVNYGYGGKMNPRLLMKQMMNPCIIASVLGVALLFLGVRLPNLLFETVDSIGSITVPLSMLVVGIQLGSSRLSGVFYNRNLMICSLLKMIFWPVLTFLAVNWLPIPVNMKLALCFGAVFPSAVASVAITSMENRNAVLAAEMVAVTTFISLLTIPAGALLLMGCYGLI